MANIFQEIRDLIALRPKISSRGKTNLAYKVLQPLAGVQNVAQNVARSPQAPLQVQVPQIKLKNPVANFAANLPGTLAGGFINAPGQYVQGIARMGVDVGQGKLTPKRFLSNTAQIAQLPLMVTGGGAAKGVLSAGEKNLLARMGAGALTGAKFGGAFGALGGFQSGRDIKNNTQYLQNLGVNTAAGVALGGALGGVIPVVGDTVKVGGKLIKVTKANLPDITTKLASERGSVKIPGQATKGVEPTLYGAGNKISMRKSASTNGINVLWNDTTQKPLEGISTATKREIHQAQEAANAARGTGADNVMKEQRKLYVAVDKGIREAGVESTAVTINPITGQKVEVATKGVEGVTYRGANVAQEAVQKDRILHQSAVSATKEAPPIKSPVLKLPTEGGVPPNVPGSPSSGAIIPQSDEELVTTLSQALKGAEKTRGTQEALYSKARGQQFARLMASRSKMAGEKGFYEELGALKGELPKAQYEPIRQTFNQQSIDRLYNMVKSNKALDEWDKLNAQVGLAKILGEKGVGVPTKGEIDKLYTVFGKEFTEALLSKRTVFEKLSDWGMQLYNLPRSTMAGFGDLSATLMQNLMFAYRHPFMTSKNFGEQLKMFASDKAYKVSGEEIASRPTYELMKQAKIAFTDVGPIVKGREEQFMAPLAEKIPVAGKVIKMTSRAYSGFLNRMRADVFDNLYYSAKSGGVDVKSERFLATLGEFVNAGTGRGNLPGSLERAAPILAQGFFSARKLAAAFQLINPVFYVRAHPFVRMEALKTWASFVGGGLTILGVAKLAGADVSNDPTSADFGKIKVGNTRFNVFGTYQQVAVLLARLYKGYATSSTTGTRMTLGEGYKPLTRLDLIVRFFENKEHPTISFISGMISGQNNIGDAFNIPKEALNRFIPMVLADAYDLYREHGPVGLLGMMPAILGVPVQTYGAQIPTRGLTAGGRPNIQYNPAPGLGEAIVNKVTGTPESNMPKEQWKPIVSQHTRELLQKEITTIQNQINVGSIKSEDGLKRIKELQDKISSLKVTSTTGTTAQEISTISPPKLKAKKAKKITLKKGKKGKKIKAPKLSFKKPKLAKMKFKSKKLAKVKQYKTKGIKGVKQAKLPEKVTYRLHSSA